MCLFVDRPNFIFAMSHAPMQARVWKDDLLADRLDDKVARRVGSFLGLMHESSFRNRDQFHAFRDSHVFVQLRVEPFYRTVAARRPEVAVPIAALIEEMLTLTEALCHGDYTPKNILVHGEDFTLVDYETAYLGDPAMDLGLCLAHLVLKAFRRLASAARYLHLMRAFWDGYRGQVIFRSAAELEMRAARTGRVPLGPHRRDQSGGIPGRRGDARRGARFGTTAITGCSSAMG